MTDQLAFDLAFSFDGNPIHAFLFHDRPAWLVAEVGAALGLADAARGVRESKAVEKGTDYDVVSPEILPLTESDSVSQRAPAVTILFESGLYALVLRSNKPAAIRFTRWVIREVLPALREQGQVSMLPTEFQGEALSTGQLLKLVDMAGRGNAYAQAVVESKGLHPLQSEASHG